MSVEPNPPPPPLPIVIVPALSSFAISAVTSSRSATWSTSGEVVIEPAANLRPAGVEYTAAGERLRRMVGP